jgi:hypothetical protein
MWFYNEVIILHKMVILNKKITLGSFIHVYTQPYCGNKKKRQAKIKL